MDSGDEPAQPGLFGRREIDDIDVARDAIRTARNLQQVFIELPIPIPTEAEIEKRLVERLTMKLLGVDEGAVHVKEQGLELHHAASIWSAYQSECGDDKAARSPPSRKLVRSRLAAERSASAVQNVGVTTV